MSLTLPPASILKTRTASADERPFVRDPIRRRWVRLTPEEGVRQRLLRAFLTHGYPSGLLAVERGLHHLGRTWRADVVLHGRDGRPLLIAECKAPTVGITQDTFDQLARYNVALGARALVATNGDATYCAIAEPTETSLSSTWRFTDHFPSYQALLEAP